MAEQQKSEVARFGSNSIYGRKSPHNAAIMQFAPKFHELSFCPKYCAQSSFSHDLPLIFLLSTVCCLKETAGFCRQTDGRKGVVENLLDSVRQFGFVPNGARIYYLDRWKHVELKGGRKAKVDEDDEGNVTSPG